MFEQKQQEREEKRLKIAKACDRIRYRLYRAFCKQEGEGNEGMDYQRDQEGPQGLQDDERANRRMPDGSLEAG